MAAANPDPDDVIDETSPKGSLRVRDALGVWIDQRLEGLEEVSVPEIIDEALEYVRESPELLNDYLARSLRPFIRQRIDNELTSRRGLSLKGDHLVVVDKKAFRNKADALAARWQATRLNKHLEWVPGVGHKAWHRMTATDLQAVRTQRHERAAENAVYAEFAEALLKRGLELGLDPSEEAEVKDVMSPEEFDQLAEQVMGDNS